MMPRSICLQAGLLLFLAAPALLIPRTGDAMDTSFYLRQVVTKLAWEIGVRTYRDDEPMARTAAYISSELSSFGCAVTRQSFTYEGHMLQNIIGERKGTDPAAPILVIGAHYDTVRTTPGADDNGSGIAGLLGIARLLAGRQPHRTIRFVAFAFEEPPSYRTHHMGSYQYAKALHDGGALVEGMICLEMIGFFSDAEGSQHYPLPFMNRVFPKTGNFIAMVGNRRSKGFTERLAGAFKKATDLPLITLNAPAFVVGIDFSDHWSFNKFDYPAFMVTDTAFYRNLSYHSPADLPETLDYGRMAKVVEGLAAAVMTGVSAPLPD
jgi:Zn-dependent M28 family amino/carboxypeptidase